MVSLWHGARQIPNLLFPAGTDKQILFKHLFIYFNISILYITHASDRKYDFHLFIQLPQWYHTKWIKIRYFFYVTWAAQTYLYTIFNNKKQYGICAHSWNQAKQLRKSNEMISNGNTMKLDACGRLRYIMTLIYKPKYTIRTCTKVSSRVNLDTVHLGIYYSMSMIWIT